MNILTIITVQNDDYYGTKWRLLRYKMMIITVQNDDYYDLDEISI